MDRHRPRAAHALGRLIGIAAALGLGTASAAPAAKKPAPKPAPVTAPTDGVLTGDTLALMALEVARAAGDKFAENPSNKHTAQEFAFGVVPEEDGEAFGWSYDVATQRLFFQADLRQMAPVYYRSRLAGSVMAVNGYGARFRVQQYFVIDIGFRAGSGTAQHVVHVESAPPERARALSKSVKIIVRGRLDNYPPVSTCRLEVDDEATPTEPTTTTTTACVINGRIERVIFYDAATGKALHEEPITP